MKKLLAALLVGLLTAGCWSRIEVNDLAIVSMMAIDRTEDGQIGIWLQVVVPSQAGGISSQGGAAGNPQGLPFITLHARGRTVLEASRQAQLELSRRLFWAHSRVVLIGEQLARSNVRDALDFLTRHRELRLTNYVMTVQGPVEPLVSTRIDLERLPVEVLRELSRSRIGLRVNVGEFTSALASPAGAAVTSVAEVTPPPDGAPEAQKSGLKLAGTAIYRQGKLVGFLDDHETRGLLWLRDEVERGTITVELPETEGFVSLEWVAARVRRTARMEGNQLVIDVTANTEGDVSEESAKLDLTDPKVVAKIGEQMSTVIEERMKLALSRLREYNADAAGFGDVVHQQLPGVWRQMGKRWQNDGFRRAKVVVHVEAHVRRTGLTSKPRGVPETELNKGGP